MLQRSATEGKDAVIQFQLASSDTEINTALIRPVSTLSEAFVRARPGKKICIANGNSPACECMSGIGFVPMAERSDFGQRKRCRTICTRDVH